MLYSILFAKKGSTMPRKKRPDSETDIAVLNRRLVELKKQMNKLGPVMRGSLVVIGTRNKQPYFSVNRNRKTHLIYLGNRREGKAREYSDNYRALQEIVEEMTVLNMRLLKLDDGG
jgi:hypothetical protein